MSGLTVNECSSPGCRRLTIGGTCPDHRAAPPVVSVVPDEEPARVTRRVIRPEDRNVLGGERPRNKDDAYYTHPKLARAVCRELRFRTAVGVPQVLVEPSAGRGAFVEAARAVWGNAPHIIAVEKNRADNFALLDRAGADEVLYQRWEETHHVIPSGVPYEDNILVLGNPPFDPDKAGRRGKPTMAENHLRLALERLGHGKERTPVGRFVAFILPGTFLATEARSTRQHIGRGGLRYVRNLVERPSFLEDGGSMMTEYVLCVWQAGYRGPYEGDWLSWKDDTDA